MKTITPGIASGTIKAPPSKSMAQRALAIASLIKGSSKILMGTPCDDIESAMRATSALGGSVNAVSNGVEIEGFAQKATGTLDCGEAGLSLRMFSAVAATLSNENILIARGSLASRPTDMITAPLIELGAKCKTENNLPPVTVQGPLAGGEIKVDATVSSQFLTGLLIALCFVKEDSIVHAPGLKSKPYVEMTINLLNKIGASIKSTNNFERFEICGGLTYKGFDYQVPGDWSGASFPLVAGAISNEVTVTGLDKNSSQADIKIIEALKLCGATVTNHNDSFTVSKPTDGNLEGFKFDATHCPDLFPPLAALAANCKGKSKLRGVHRLASKECDREAAIIEEFKKLGMIITVEDDEMIIEGGDLHGGSIDSHEDHRMAMAMSLAALNASGPVKINGDNSINKSYPDFFEDLKKLGIAVN